MSFENEWNEVLDVKITGYGVFESTDGEIFVGYYDTNTCPYEIEEDNFYATELEATQVALTVANEKRLEESV